MAGKTMLHDEIELLGVRVDMDPGAEEEVARIALEAARLSGHDLALTAADVRMNSEFVGEGYGIPTEAGMEAIRTLWTTEGILLDPVYTGKAMSGLRALMERGELAGKRVVFLHTGGEPSVFAAAGLF